jgi:uncharacterized protein (TIGR03435 family)
METFVNSVGLVIFAVGAALAQPVTDQPGFEVASVKPSPPGNRIGSMDGGPMPTGPFNMANHDPERITWTNVRLIRVLMMAYDLPADRISGPGWLDTEMYDIVATVPKGATVPDFKRMVQNLLAERFKLTLHRDTKEVSGYALEVAKNGLKIKESKNPPEPSAAKSDGKVAGSPIIVDESGFPAPRPGNPIFSPGSGFSATIKVNGMYRATVLNQSMPEIAKFLGTAAGMPVEDHTGMTGVYDFHLEYKPTLPAATASPADTAADIDAPRPDLLDAVQAQLGLRLVRKRVPRETLVIDYAERVPTEN